MQKARLFITEDEFIVARNLQRRLEAMGYEVVGSTGTGEETLELLPAAGADLVLMDIRLAGSMDGIETAEHISKKFDLPVIFITAYSNKSIIDRAKLAMPYGYVVKPFQERELGTTIEIALYKHGVEKQLKENEKALRLLNEKLEEKVAERTSELTKLNKELQKEIQERIRTEVALKISEEEYKGVFENAHDAIIIIEPGTENVLNVNQRACEIYGFSKEEFIGISMSSISKYKDRKDDFVQLIMQNGGRYSFETVQYRKDGSEMFLEVNATFIYYKNRKAFLSINRDVTERKLAEQALRDSEKKYRDLTESLPQTIFESDESGRVTYINKNGCKIFGYRENEILGRNMLQFIIPEQRKKAIDIIRQKIDGNHIIGTEYTGLRKDGSTFPVVIYTTIVSINQEFRGFRGLLLDITERKKSEEELRKLSRVIEQTDDNVMITDNTGRIEYVNPAFIKHFGYSREEIVGRYPNMVKSGKHDSSFYESMWHTILSGSVCREVFINKKKNNELFYEEKTITPIKDSNGLITHFVSTGKDITSRILSEEKIKENENRFRSLLQNSSDIIVVISREGVIKYESPAVFRVLGYADNEVIGKNIFEFIHPGDLGQAGKFIHEVINSPSSNIISEFRFRSRSGSWIVLESIANNLLGDRTINGIIVNLRDITERKRAEQKIIEDQLFISSITNTVPVIIYIYDVNASRMLYTNNKVTEKLGYTSEEMISFKACEFAELIHPDDRERFMNRILVFKELPGKDVIESEFRIRHKTGGYKWLSSREVVFKRDKNNRPVQLLGSASDITEKKMNEKRLEAMSKLQAIHKQKAQAIRSLSLLKGQEDERRRISREIHDSLGQMLTAVKLNLETLIGSREYPQEEQVRLQSLREMLKSTIAEARRLSHDLMPSTLYDFGLLSAIKQLIDQLNKSSLVSISFEHNDMNVRPERNIEISLYRTLQEALNNALKHAGAQNIIVKLESHNSTLSLEVTDDGAGFRADAISTTGSGKKGGIGINNMRERIALIGGELQIISQPGKGCKIIATITTKRKNE